jgi:methionine-rich copper-binding protein CopC
MRIPSLLPGIAMITFAVTAHAHAHLLKSNPADNSEIVTSPPNLVLNFSEAAQLTALSIQKGADPQQKLTPPRTDAAPQISVPLPPLTPGVYTVSWRVLSADGHVMSGALRFTLSADHAANHAD